jgi:hypothetical protein
VVAVEDANLDFRALTELLKFRQRTGPNIGSSYENILWDMRQRHRLRVGVIVLPLPNIPNRASANGCE